MTNKGEVYFALVGDDFDPSEVTHLVGLKPTSTARKSSPLPKQTYWQVSSGESENDFLDIYEMSSALVAQLKPHTAKIAHAKQLLGLQAVLQVVLWITSDETKSTPAIGFDQECISFLNAVGASIDIDTYRSVS